MFSIQKSYHFCSRFSEEYLSANCISRCIFVCYDYSWHALGTRPRASVGAIIDKDTKKRAKSKYGRGDVGEQAFRLRANAPRGKRGLRGKRGGKVSESWSGLTHLKVSNHALSPLVPLVPLMPLCFSRRSSGAQSISRMPPQKKKSRRIVLAYCLRDLVCDGLKMPNEVEITQQQQQT